MRALAGFLVAISVAANARAESAVVFETRYAHAQRPIAARSFELQDSGMRIDGSAFGMTDIRLNGAEISMLRLTDHFALGPMVGLVAGHGPPSRGSLVETSVVNARGGLEGRAVATYEHLSVWVGAVLGISGTTIDTGFRRADRFDLLFEPRAGLDLPLIDSGISRTALGVWGGAEPLNQSWTAGLSISTRMYFERGRFD